MSGPIPARERLNRATAGALARGEEVSAERFGELRDQLLGYVRRTVDLRSDSDYHEAVDSAVERFLIAARTHRVRPATALAYLRTIARNVALDESRRSQRFVSEEPSEHRAESEDQIARHVDERATAELIEQMLRECVAEGDRAATRVINSFLNLAEELDATPSSRLVAERAGVSHTTVQNVLKRLRERISGAIRLP